MEKYINKENFNWKQDMPTDNVNSKCNSENFYSFRSNDMREKTTATNKRNKV